MKTQSFKGLFVKIFNVPVSCTVKLFLCKFASIHEIFAKYVYLVPIHQEQLARINLNILSNIPK